VSFERPTLLALATRIRADFVSRLTDGATVLSKSIVNVLAIVIAGAVHLLYGLLDFIFRQLFPDTSEAASLIRQAGLFGVTKNPAGYAKATVSVTGTGTIEADTILARAADGAEYGVDEEVTISGSGSISVTALLAGSDSTLLADQELQFESPISGVDSMATVTASTEDGTEEETIEELRTRFLERLAEPPMGGTDADYIAWSKRIAGVTRVWPVPRGLGPGTVLVRFVRDNDGSGAAIIPSAGEVSAVQDYLDEKAPAHATVTVSPPVGFAQDFEFGSITPDNSTVRAAVEAELADLLHREAGFDSETGDPLTIPISQIRAAITNAGATDYDLLAPISDVEPAAGHIPYLGSVTWP
jgi:uncharacterized phage protein gp47/JayE